MNTYNLLCPLKNAMKRSLKKPLYLLLISMSFFCASLSGKGAQTPPSSPPLVSKENTSQKKSSSSQKIPIQEDTSSSSLNKEQKDMESFDINAQILNTLLALGAILILIVLASWFLKKILKNRVFQLNQNCRIKIIEQRNLHAKAQLYLIEVSGQEVLIAESPMGLHPLLKKDIESKQKDKSFQEILEET